MTKEFQGRQTGGAVGLVRVMRQLGTARLKSRVVSL